MDEKLKDVIRDYLQANNLNENALDMLVEEYEDMQEFVEQNGTYIMTTGNSVDEVSDFIKHRDIEDLLKSDDKKVQALADFLFEEEGEYVPACDIEVEENKWSYMGAEYHTPFGTFNVLIDKEADEAMVTYQEDLWDDLGLDAFTEYAQDYVINNCIGADNLEDYMYEDYESYYTDIESESDIYFENRLQRELAEKDRFDASDLDEVNDLKDEIETLEDDISDVEDDIDDLQYEIEDLEDELDDLRDEYDKLEEDESYELIALVKKEEIEQEIKEKEDKLDDLLNELNTKERKLRDLKSDLYDTEKKLDDNEFNEWLEKYEDNKYNLIEKAVQSIIDEYDSPVEWYIDNFGKDSFKDLIKDGKLGVIVNFEKIAEFCTNEDGRGHSLSIWDGEEYEQNGFYIYKQDDSKYIPVKNIAVEKRFIEKDSKSKEVFDKSNK